MAYDAHGGCYRPAIDTLPDDVFLEIFAHCVPHYGFMGMGIDISNHMSRWKCLVQVCRRWRQLIYGSPRYLDLILYCSRTEGIPVKHLSYWPALPIAVCSRIPDDEDDVIAVLENPDCVRILILELRISRWRLGKWGKVVAAMQEPFPVLTRLSLQGHSGCDVPALPSGLLGGSAPCLQQLALSRIPFPELPTLLSSARDLVYLHLEHVPSAGYISPEAMVASLAVLTKLERLFIMISEWRPRTEQRSRPDTPMRAVLPALTDFHFDGCSEYLDDLVTEIDTPRLNCINTVVKWLGFLPVLQLFLFIGRTDNLRFSRVKMECFGDELVIKLGVDPSRHSDTNFPPHFDLSFSFEWWDTHVAHMTLVLTQAFTLCSNVEFFRLFDTVKMLHIDGMFAAQVARALEDLPEEEITEVFLSLDILILQSTCREFISAEQFASLRRLNGCPVTIPDCHLSAHRLRKYFEE